jgi:hypothetical protein
MAEKQWVYPQPQPKPMMYPPHPPAHDYESSSQSSHYGKYAYHGESSPSSPHYGHVPHGVTKVKVQKIKATYDPGYHHAPAPSHHCPPIVCDPQYVVRDCYVPREVPVVHPIVNVNRHVIVNVPRHYYQPVTRNVVVDPGCPDCHHGSGY